MHFFLPMIRNASEYLKQQRGDEMPGYLSWDNEKTQLEAENARLQSQLEEYRAAAGHELRQLRAELEALKPKPVIRERYTQLTSLTLIGLEQSVYFTDEREECDNLKLTFHDGKLVKAEVIND